MFPPLTRPRGCRKATLELVEAASNAFKASANDSLLDTLKLETFPAEGSDFVGKEVAEDELKTPVHALGVDQALGGGGAGFGSSATTSSVDAEAGCVASSSTAADVIATVGSSEDLEEVGLGISWGRDLGIAGIIGRAVAAALEAFGVIGVVSPWAGAAEFCADEGVVGSVDSVCSEAG